MSVVTLGLPTQMTGTVPVIQGNISKLPSGANIMGFLFFLLLNIVKTLLVA